MTDETAKEEDEDCGRVLNNEAGVQGIRVDGNCEACQIFKFASQPRVG